MVSPDGEAAGGIAVVGDPLRRLFDEQYVGMVRLACLLLGSSSAAEDVVQEAFVAVDGKLGNVPVSAHAAYLRRAVVNGARSSMRKGNARKRQVIPMRDHVTEPVDVVLGSDQHRQVLVALDTLPGRQRECLVLRYYAGLTDNEIAENLSLGGDGN